MENRITEILRRSRKPMSKKIIAKKAYKNKNQYIEFNEAFNRLVKSGTIIAQRGKFTLKAGKAGLVEGQIVKVLGTFGFVTPDDGTADLFIPGRFLLGGMPGDKVLVKKVKGSRGDSTEGEVVKITEMVNHAFAGVMYKTKNGNAFMVPDSLSQLELAVDTTSTKGVENGSKVLAEVVKRGKSHREHIVKILEYFGSADSAESCAKAILAEKDIVDKFPEEVLELAKEIGSSEIHPKELAVRKDLREWNIFTIDGADTKDIDDAISLVKTESGWQLGVHIADVSYYVARQSPIDKEAYQRGNSVYYANKVVPMLPKELSNGICSLNPDEDRLAVSAIINLDKSGEIETYRFEKTVIRSRIKGVYDEINEIFAGKATKETLGKYIHQTAVLNEMRELADVFYKSRARRGAVNLESTESKIIIDESGKITDIVPRKSGIAENMIEEFMLTANQAAALFAGKEKIPFVYRVHEEPDPERVEKLFGLLDSLGISYRRPKDKEGYSDIFAEILEKVKDTHYKEVVNYSMLRVMAKAKYSDESLGHFGLALKDYAHFTSPIRRYSDLIIHRIITGLLTGMRKENIEKRFREWVPQASEQCNRREVAAMTAEREIDDCYKAEYMQQFIGDEFEGTVSSVTGFGLYIQLASTVEGLVKASTLPGGNWKFDNIISYVDSVGSGKISVGDDVRVKVMGAQVSAGTIDFELIVK